MLSKCCYFSKTSAENPPLGGAGYFRLELGKARTQMKHMESRSGPLGDIKATMSHLQKNLEIDVKYRDC